MGKGEGKGRGRGGCGALEAAGDCVQCIATTICLICIAGPICIIVGIAFISSAFNDTRSEKIDEFKVAVDTWMDGAVDGFASTQADWSYTIANSCGGNVPATSLTLSNTPEDLGSESGESDFVGYTVVQFEDTSPPSASDTVTAQQATCQLDISILFQDTVVGNVSTPVSSETVYGFDDICSRSTSNRQTSSGTRTSTSNESSDVNSCRNSCSNRGGTSTGSTYTTFQCTVLEQPSGVCVRVTSSGDTWAQATGTLPDRTTGASGPGCFLPLDISAFASGGGGSWEEVQTEPATGGALQVPIQVRSERDPFLYFLDISGGTKNFGLTTGEKLRIGFSLLAIGLLLTCCVCACCCGIVKFAHAIASGKKERPNNAVGGAMYDVAGKYGNYIPGGASLGQPVPGQTVAGHPAGKPPTGYPGGGAGYGGGTGGAQPYDGGSSYDTPNVSYGVHGGGAGYPGGPGGNQYGAPAGGNTGGASNVPWGNAGNTANQYGSSAPAYATGGNTGAPAGYPTAV